MKQYTNSEITFLIDEYIHSERDRKVLKRRLIDKITIASLAEEFDYSVRHMQRIVSKAEKELMKYMK